MTEDERLERARIDNEKRDYRRYTKLVAGFALFSIIGTRISGYENIEYGEAHFFWGMCAAAVAFLAYKGWGE